MENTNSKTPATKSNLSIGNQVYTELSLLDQATVQYHAHGLEFIQLLDYYLNCPPSAKRFVFSAPRYLVLAEEIDYENPEDPYSKKVAPYWHVAWQQCMDGFAKTLYEIAPYKLDKVCFMRNKRGILSGYKFYPWNKMKRICNYGIKT
jgi:hypothetical protein